MTVKQKHKFAYTDNIPIDSKRISVITVGPMSDNKLRIRWAAIGAAIAVTIGTGGLIGVNAAQTDQSSTFVPVTPTRIFDTRSSAKIGNFTEGTITELQVTGSIKTAANETKVVVPTGSTAVSANVTVVAGETGPYDGYVTVYPCDVKRPDASSLNFINAQTIPNAVSVPLSANGKVCIYVYGKAHILFDIVGYYSTTSISDLNASINQLQEELDDKASQTDIDDSLADVNSSISELESHLETSVTNLSNELDEKGSVSIIEDSQGRQKEAVTFPGSSTTYVLINGAYYPIDSKGFKATADLSTFYYSQLNCTGDIYVIDRSSEGSPIKPSNAVLVGKKIINAIPSNDLWTMSLDSNSPIPSNLAESYSYGNGGYGCRNQTSDFGVYGPSPVKIIWGYAVPVTEFTPPYTLVTSE
jgi:hypothetical protein